MALLLLPPPQKNVKIIFLSTVYFNQAFKICTYRQCGQKKPNIFNSADVDGFFFFY